MNTMDRFTVQVASSFTSTPLESSLRANLIQASVGEGVRFVQYDQMGQYMLGTASDAPEILGTIVLLRVEDWLLEDLKSAPAEAKSVSHNQIHSQLRSRVNEFVGQIGALASRGKQVWFLACPSRGWIAEKHKVGTLCQTYTNLVVARVQNDRQVSTLRWPSALFTGEVEDNRTDRLGRIPFTQTAFDSLGEFLGSQIAQTSLRRDLCAAPSAPPSLDELAEYLDGLKVHVQIAPAEDMDRDKLDRILRIAADFTLTGQNTELPDAEIDRLMASGWCMRIVVSDRLANYGASGILALRPTSEALVVSSMSLSCTVLGKQVEFAVLSALSEIASDLKVEKILFEFNPTERNQPTRRFLDSVADRVSDTRFVLPLALSQERLKAAAINVGTWTLELERGLPRQNTR
jgi:hypothetical protein